MPKKYNYENINKFIESLKEIYPFDFPNVEKGLKIKRQTTFRVNKLKGNSQEVEKSLENEGFLVKKGTFPESYIVTSKPEDKHLSDTAAFIEGKLYVQELASMIPPLVLNPKPGDKILDMASAPGSKTTQMAAMTNNEAEILALEKHPLRIKTLQHNLKIQGADNTTSLRIDSMEFQRRNPQFIEYFDKILVDAPCSSEGRFNLNDPKSYKYWNIHKRKEMSRIQKGLLMSGIRMLKPGGTLVYSTCTFGTEENEQVLQWLKDKIPEISIEKIEIPIKNVKPGLNSWKEKKFDSQIRNAIRVVPDELFGGFFIAKLKKKKATH